MRNAIAMFREKYGEEVRVRDFPGVSMVSFPDFFHSTANQRASGVSAVPLTELCKLARARL